MVRNIAVEKMRGGGAALGVVLRYEGGHHIAQAMRASGFDWLFLDLEHGAMSMETVAALSLAGLDAGITPVVRVPAMDLGMAIRALDNGALGILMPHVETAEEAQSIAAAFRYPPVGHRSISSTLPHFRFMPPPLAQACRELDGATMVGVLLETPKAIENADAIAAVPGIDMLMIGASDLSAEADLHGQYDHPRIQSMFEKAVAAAGRHDKLAGVGGVGDAGGLARCVRMGMKMIVAAVDISLLMSAASTRTRTLRDAMGDESPQAGPGNAG